MGSATTQALAASTTALSAAAGIDLAVSRELFAAAGVIGTSTQLGGALADPATTAEVRTQLVEKIFSGYAQSTRQILGVAVAQRWSTASDLVDGIEELAVRAATVAAPTADIEGELFSFSRVIAQNPELELALGSRFGDAEARGALVEKVLSGSADAATVLVAASLVQSSRGRRVRQLLARAGQIIAEQRERLIATVYTAAPLSAAQRTRLGDALGIRYGGRVQINEVIDSTVVGGLRVQIADDVIDGSISARLADLRQRLAG